ncbi:hypothetical protein JW948_01075 [bacterium]|nr:hypothetical protein [bacterium]
MPQFDENGRLIIPISRRPKKKVNEKKVKYVITEAYCPNGCNIMDAKYPINGYPGLHLKFRRPGMEGEFILSSIECDFSKIVLSGNLEDGVKDELYCPHCGIMFEKLVSCNCKPDADMVIIGLSPKLDFNHAITFCNVTGCTNGTFVNSGTVLRHMRLQNGF